MLRLIGKKAVKVFALLPLLVYPARNAARLVKPFCRPAPNVRRVLRRVNARLPVPEDILEYRKQHKPGPLLPVGPDAVQPILLKPVRLKPPLKVAVHAGPL